MQCANFEKVRQPTGRRPQSRAWVIINTIHPTPYRHRRHLTATVKSSLYSPPLPANRVMSWLLRSWYGALSAHSERDTLRPATARCNMVRKIKLWSSRIRSHRRSSRLPLKKTLPASSCCPTIAEVEWGVLLPSTHWGILLSPRPYPNYYHYWTLISTSLYWQTYLILHLGQHKFIDALSPTT